MKHLSGRARGIAPLALLVAFLASPGTARAHCDTLDGPVVKAAEQALARGDVTRVLIWVQPKDEAELRSAFDHALAVRKLGPEAQRLADRFFFETLVRVHRAGEGAPYTGLKPAGADLDAAIPAADRALETGDVAALHGLINEALEHGLQERFQAARETGRYAPGDVSAGRRYVAAYVEFVHYVEAVHQAARHGAGGHGAGEAAPPPAATEHGHGGQGSEGHK